MKAVPLKRQDGKCIFQNKASFTYGCWGGRECCLLAAASSSPGRGSTIHVSIAKSLGGQRLRTGKKFYWNTSLMQNPQSQALVSPSSGCLALLVLKKKTIIRDVQFLELHTCILICVSSGFGWWSLLLKYWEGVSFHICCIAKQPGKSLEMILSPANHDDQFKNCRSACFACSEAFVADSAAVKKFDFPKLAQNNVGFFLLPITTIY